MQNQQVEMALIRYIMSYPNFSDLPQEEQWRISIEKRKELVQLINEGNTIMHMRQEFEA